VHDRTTFPAKALRAEESLHFSMFCDKHSKSHRSAQEFGGWDKLGWEAKLDVAMVVLNIRHASNVPMIGEMIGEVSRHTSPKGSGFHDAVHRENEGDSHKLVDLDLQRQVHLEPQRLVS